MGSPQLLNRKTLGSLGCPQPAAIWGGRDGASSIHLLDRVGYGGGGDHRCALLHRSGTAGQQLRLDKTASPVVDQHPTSSCRQGRQPPAHRLLTGVTTLNPLHRQVRLSFSHDRRYRGCINGLAHDADPANGGAGEGRIEGPGQHRPPRHWQQQLVASGPHAASAAGCGDQQMHKRLPRDGSIRI